MMIWMAAVLILAMVGVALAVLFREMASRTRGTEFDAAWIEDFSIAKYRPMLRLLSKEDYAFLASQAGYQQKIGSQLRVERRKVFRAYLSNLVRDFNRLHHAARFMAAYSEQDRPDLAVALLKQRLSFSVAVMAVKGRLILHAAGVGTVEVRNLLASVDQLRTEIGDISHATGELA